ncbi:MAG: hypothetical protein LJE95_09260 [Acidobacteria bacterium]|jgi:hypothetical protein|nr:hypothetical protein [Acidobacteriota bacterium]
MSDQDVDRLLAGLVPPPPPSGTRELALAAARAAGIREVEAEDRWSRLWRSRPARLAWATTVAALLLAHAVLTVERAAQGGLSPSPAPVASRSGNDAELAAIAELPPLRLGLLPAIDPFGRPAAASSNPSTLSSRRPS